MDIFGSWDFPIFKRNIFGEKVVQTYTLDLIHLKVLYLSDSRDFHARRPNSKPRMIAIIENQLNA